ncbi:pilus assembly protein TadG-related protein [Rhizobium sp.]
MKDRRGNFGILTALCIVPVIGACGVGLDFGIAYSKRTELQGVADAAVLHAASSGQSDPKKLKELAQYMFDTNVTTQFNVAATVQDISVDDDNHITLKANAVVPLTLGKIFRPNGIDVSVVSQALMGSDDRIEVALVLDNTYSMYGQKLADLKSASNALLNVFEKVDKKKDKVRISITPFAQYVNVGTANRNKPWLNVPADVTTTTEPSCKNEQVLVSKGQCTTETKWKDVDGVQVSYTQETCPNKTYKTEYVCRPGSSSTKTWNGCIGSRTTPLNVTDTNPSKPYPGFLQTKCTNPITTLTGDYKTLRAAISKMTVSDSEAFAQTYIPQGVLWGWNTLSADEPFNDGLSYDEDVKKFIIVMTDGANTRRPKDNDYSLHTETKNVEKADAFVEQTCANAKAASSKNPITIYTVAVGVPEGSSTAVALGKCATDGTKAYFATDSAKLAKTFEEIALEIMKPRLTM